MLYYQLTFAASVVCCLLLLWKWKKQLDISYAAMNILVVISDMGALLRSAADTLDEAVIWNIISYIGACFLQATITFCILSLSRIHLHKFWKLLMVLPGLLMYAIIVTDPWTHLYYRNVQRMSWEGITILTKEYGAFHTVFYVMIIGYFVLDVAILGYALAKKREASVKNILLLALVEMISIAVYFFQKIFPDAIQLTAISYVGAQVIVLSILDRICLYDVDNTVMNALLSKGEMGCFSFTLSGKYLGCNKIAEGWIPELVQLRVDQGMPKNHNIPILHTIAEWMETIRKNGGSAEFFYTKGENIYKVSGGYFHDRGKVKGFQFAMRDVTQEQKYITLINQYNNELEEKVEEKTQNLREMHQRLVQGMADMVESRDPSTGGHIKRTSQVVRILVDEMKKDPALAPDKKFCQAMIKAAPMHDLGKIAVDDDILRKPGRFTPEEFDKMKTHAEEGSKIVKKLLSDMEDDYFAKIAENVAHFHHERVDGTGYPCGLKGEEIPLEARIMAVADVYDALVSKRCYKESLSFERAYEIIMEGMGTQFDGKLQPCFAAAREKLETFYRQEFAGSDSEECA